VKNKYLFPLISIVFFSSSVVAEVTVAIPSNVTILVANGKTPNLTGSVFDAEKLLHLPDGTQQIFFKYKPYFTQGKNNIGVESPVLISSFQLSNKKLTIVLPKYNKLKDAKKNIRSFQWSLTTENGEHVPSINDKLIKDGIQFGRNFQTEASLYNQGKNVAAIHEFAPEMTLSDRQIHTSNTPSSSAQQNAHRLQSIAGSPSAESMLYYWYNQADPTTKMKFKAFVNKQK